RVRVAPRKRRNWMRPFASTPASTSPFGRRTLQSCMNQAPECRRARPRFDRVVVDVFFCPGQRTNSYRRAQRNHPVGTHVGETAPSRNVLSTRRERSTTSEERAMICHACGLEAPTKQVTFYQNIGMLLAHQRSWVEGELCKRCIHHYFWKFSSITLLVG